MSKRVLHIINSPGLGGAETIVKDIVIRFTEHKIFCLRYDEKDRFSSLGNRVIYGTYGKRYKINPVVLFRLLECIKSNQIKVIHVHLANSLLYALMACVLYPGTTLIYHEHGEIFYNNKLKILLKFMSCRVNLVLTVSEACRKEVKKYISSQADSRTLKNYVEIDKFSGIKHNHEKMPTVGFAGRLVFQKGCDILLNAAHVSVHPWSLVIYGDGPQKDELLKLADSLCVKDRVIFMGYEEDRKKIYQSATVFVVPSRNEAASLGIVEARAAGCIAVGSNVGGVPEYVENGVTGFLFEKENFVELAKILDSLVDNPQLRANIAKDSLVGVKQYDIVLYMEHLNEIYNKSFA